MPRIWLTPEGTPDASGTAYAPESLTWRTSTPLVRDGETVGMATISRVDRDGASWLAADVVADDTDLDLSDFTLDVDIAEERFEVSQGQGSHVVESGVLRRIVVTDPEAAELKSRAAAILAAVETDDGEVVEVATEPVRWEGVLIVEGEVTGDGRMFERGSVRWDDSQAPWPLKFDRDEGDHSAAVVGQANRIWRDGDQIRAEGIFHNQTADAETLQLVNRAIELVGPEDGPVSGVSMEWDSASNEIRVDKEVWEQRRAEMEEFVDDEMPEMEEVDGRVVLDKFTFDEAIEVTTDMRLTGMAIVDRPAFPEGGIVLAASGASLARIWLVEPETITAHAAAATTDFDAPPRAWFEMAEPDEDDPRVVWVDDEGAPCAADSEGARPWGVPLTVTADGQVYGHLASWQDCHTGFTDRCVTPPRSTSGYAWFNNKVTKTDDGPIETGVITTDTSHAPHRMNAVSAMAHYDQSGHGVADVHVTDGELGPWLAGWVRPWATAQQRHELTAHPLSGDWRPRGGSTELIGVLAVNVPGFPMPRTVATYRAGELASLVASGLPPVAEAERDELEERVARIEARFKAESALRQLEPV